MSKIQEISQAVEIGKLKEVAPLVQAALDEGIEPMEILNEGLISAMSVVGDKFKAGEYFVPDMLLAAKGMKKGLAVLKPALAGESNVSLGTCVIATVQGDLHDIGKNLVALMIETTGFEVIDLGVDVAPEKVVEVVKATPDCNIVAFSALLTTTMPSLKNTVRVLIENGIKDQAKIIVGGAPISQAFADEIGADGFAPEAASAGSLARKLVS